MVGVPASDESLVLRMGVAMAGAGDGASPEEDQ